jgi:hypothetical protein
MLASLTAFNFMSLEVFRQVPRVPYVIATFAIACLPAIGYIDTIRLMVASRSDEAYNFTMVMIIEMAQLMKILYFFYDPYALVIFGQAVTVFASAILLTFLKFRYSKEVRPSRWAPHWNIRLASSFFEHLLVLGIYLVLVYFVLNIGFAVFGKTETIAALGLIGNMLDTIISFPLFVRIVIHGKVSNVSSVLVLQYIVGDVMKVLTFMVVATPFVFVLGAYCQCCVDGLTALTFFHLLCLGRGASDWGEPLVHPELARL